MTVLQEPNKVPTAFISIAGEIYCPSCINAKGLFLELNNGMPSGGAVVDHKQSSLLVEMLQSLQNSKNINELEENLNVLHADYSLIVNAADANNVSSYEYSTTLGMQSLLSNQQLFASTNFYLNPAWQNLPPPTDATTWLGVTRRNNLIALFQDKHDIDIESFQAEMNKTLKEGGALWEATIYQLIYDAHNQMLYVKLHHPKTNWTAIPLGALFKRETL